MIGISRTVRGLFNTVDSVHTSRYNDAICSTVASPGTGIVSNPVPHTAEYSSKSFIP